MHLMHETCQGGGLGRRQSFAPCPLAVCGTEYDKGRRGVVGGICNVRYEGGQDHPWLLHCGP